MPKNSSSLSLSKLFISKKASVYRESIIFKCCERSFASASSEEASRASLFYIPDEKPQPPLTPKFASHANKDDNDVKSGSLGSVHKYIIRRTRLGKQLPLYTEFKSGRTRILTIIRKIEGDFQVQHSPNYHYVAVCASIDASYCGLLL